MIAGGLRSQFRHHAQHHRALERIGGHAKNIAGFPCKDFGWNDVGSWEAVWQRHLGPGGSFAFAMKIRAAREGGIE